MFTFIYELVNWIKARKYRDELAGKPYFWGSPNSQEGYDRHNAFLVACGKAPTGFYKKQKE